MPAAAVIPAPIAYFKVVAVKKLVVGSRAPVGDAPFMASTCPCFLPRFDGTPPVPLTGLRRGGQDVYFEKLECSRQAAHLNYAAWNNGIGPRFYFVGLSGPEVMIKRESQVSAVLEVKFLDHRKTNKDESICKGCFR